MIDISKPVGSRIVSLAYADGSPIGDADPFVLAVNNYRQSGGGAYPAVAAAPLVYDERLEIRQLLIDWASTRGVIDPADFFVQNWALTTVALADAPGAGNDPAAVPGASPELAATGSHGATSLALLGSLMLLAGAWLVVRRRVA